MSLFPLFITAVFFLLNHNPLAIKDDEYKEEAISYLKSEMVKKKIPGLQVAVIRNNEITLSESLGLANVPDKVSGEYIEGEQLLEVNEEFPDMLKADSGVFRTAEDMAKWILSLQGHKLLKKKESISQIWEPIKLSNGEYGGFGGDLNAYAHGWPVIHRNKHPALAAIGRASFIIYPKDDPAIVSFTNLSGSDPVPMIEKISTYYL